MEITANSFINWQIHGQLSDMQFVVTSYKYDITRCINEK